MTDSLTFHLCETDLGWVGLVLSSHGLRATTLPRDTRDEALLEVMELGATVPARDADLADLPERICALASGRLNDPVQQLVDPTDAFEGLDGIQRIEPFTCFCGIAVLVQCLLLFGRAFITER